MSAGPAVTRDCIRLVTPRDLGAGTAATESTRINIARPAADFTTSMMIATGLSTGVTMPEQNADYACPTCHGSGLVWRSTGSNRRGRVNEDHEPCVAAFHCPTCPDDGSGNSVGTGRVLAPIDGSGAPDA